MMQTRMAFALLLSLGLVTDALVRRQRRTQGTQGRHHHEWVDIHVRIWRTRQRE
ncbi:hypothetical protein PQ472_11215 [Lacticaseibacillus pabuli]|uniref:Uncharacterized protein n=1 Tax=Lacticaseibacillus pabuli TaxID=3025672 RepID=A0ABY7WTX8_9LACO|nr:hypothetical protein [Lacticaseibacillus sp. KACC 23028]WDF82446.1 hypothetical protein PQ472_11215 [Lacticaseibacillus sp. KACC 23028]